MRQIYTYDVVNKISLKCLGRGASKLVRGKLYGFIRKMQAENDSKRTQVLSVKFMKRLGINFWK